MASLSENLTLLAEAAPDPFFAALEQLLEGDGAALRPIFNESQHFLAPSSPHPGLLWALEMLAWDPNYLTRAAQLLARLDAIDPGGKLGNRPINSLRSIFLSWSPNTNANLKQRLASLKYVLSNSPDIAWRLLLKLFPKQGDSSNQNEKPKFREAGSSDTETLTYAIVWESEREIISLALTYAQDNSERLITLLESMGHFDPESREKTLDVIERYLADHSSDQVEQVWEALRKEGSRNKTFGDAEWAIKGEELARIVKIIKKYEPTDPIRLNAWLFNDWNPDVPGKIDGLVDPLEAARCEAVQTVLSQLGTDGLQSFVEQIEIPQLLGKALETSDIDISGFAFLIQKSIGREDKLTHFASVASAVAYQRFGDQWITKLKELLTDMNWSAIEVARLLIRLPEDRRSWQLVSEFGQEIESAFWTNRQSHMINGDANDLEFVVSKYISIGRYVAAIEALNRRTTEVSTSLLLELLDAAIPEINRLDGAAGSHMLTYYIEKIFDTLTDRTDVTLHDIAQREFAYLPMIEHRKKPLVMHRLLIDDPELFISLIKTVFKPASGEEQEITEERRRLATAAYGVLGSITLLPGQYKDEVNVDALKFWCLEVRSKAAECDRTRIVDTYIGHILAHAPTDKSDNAWPHLAVRQVLEVLRSDDVEHGIAIERNNMRGVYRKSIGEGGDQERIIASQVREWAKLMPNYPRTLALLNRISESWLYQANQEDVRAEKDQLKW